MEDGGFIITNATKAEEVVVSGKDLFKWLKNY
jgi:hypothetical protein